MSVWMYVWRPIQMYSDPDQNKVSESDSIKAKLLVQNSE